MIRHARALVSILILALATQGCSWRSLISWTGLFRTPRVQVASVPASAVPGSATSLSTSPPSEETETPDAHTLLRAADRAFERDSLESAEAKVREALALEPSNAAALSRLSRLFHVTGRHAQAVERFSGLRDGRLNVARAERHTLLAGLALHLDALGEWAEAEAVLSEIPANERTLDGGARVFLMLRGETPDAATELAEAQMGQQSRDAVHANNAGIVRLRRGEAESARKAFERAIELDAKRPGPYYNLAILEKYYRLDDDAAAKWFARYRARSSQDPDSLFAVFGRDEAKPFAEREP